jgi:very-short-patch-repair endonuclease
MIAPVSSPINSSEIVRKRSFPAFRLRLFFTNTPGMLQKKTSSRTPLRKPKSSNPNKLRYLAFYSELRKLGEPFVIDSYRVGREDLTVLEAEKFPHYHPKRNKGGNLRLRDYRFDVAFPRVKLAVEIDGGVFSGGRHSRGAGYREDTYKLNLAALLGWTVLRYLPEDLFKMALTDIAVFLKEYQR